MNWLTSLLVLVVPAKTKYELFPYHCNEIECHLKDFPIHFDGIFTWERRKKSGAVGSSRKTVGSSKVENKFKYPSLEKCTSLPIKADETAAESSGFYICTIEYQNKTIRSDEIELCVYARKLNFIRCYIRLKKS